MRRGTGSPKTRSRSKGKRVRPLIVLLPEKYRSQCVTDRRAPHRLSVWLKKDDLVFRNDEDIRADIGKKLVKALNRPDYFGYSLKLVTEHDHLDEASPSAIGTLAYIAYE